MSHPGPRRRDAPAPPVVFFLSDYGLADEFVGVVHAVLVRLVPGVAVVDLTHGIPGFDVQAGAEALSRAVPHLGPGVVLGVVDPGVGSARRGVAVRAGDGRWLVAPDNGLVVPAAEASGGVDVVLALRKPADVPATFDGRDVFAPAAAALATGADLASVGDRVDPSSLVRLARPEVVRRQVGGRTVLRSPVTWVDKFGNVQLAASEEDGPAIGAPGATERVTVRSVVGGAVGATAEGTAVGELEARRVQTFAELAGGELGVLADANGRLAVVLREGSAAELTRLVAGEVVELVW